MTPPDTPTKILAAARACVLADGYAALSTRRVATAAGVPLSQIHYHFGKKEQLIAAILNVETERLLDRQRSTFATELPLWRQWEAACDHFDEDIESGFVRVHEEMIAAGWSSPALAEAVERNLLGWTEVLTAYVERLNAAGITLPGLSVEATASLISAMFLGADTLVLSGLESATVPIREALRAVGRLIKLAEEGSKS